MKVVLGETIEETIIQKSRFITYLKEVTSSEDAIHYIKLIKKRHHDANHNCSAYIIGQDDLNKRSSDDGEPQGTAGKPMLECLEKNNIYNTVCVVTRYFGGIKLGAGGLIRAYQKCTSNGLLASNFYQEVCYDKISVSVAFDMIGSIEKHIRENYTLLDTLYTDKVEYIISAKNYEDTQKSIQDRLNGKCEIAFIEKIIEKEKIED